MRQNMAVTQYEKAIETAMREVLDALSSRTALQEQVKVLAEQRDALQERSRLARLRYEHEDLQYFESLPDWRRDFSLYYYHKKAAFLSLIVQYIRSTQCRVFISTPDGSI